MVNRMPSLTVQQVEQFWTRVDASGDCWDWVGPLKLGYGHMRVKNRTFMAHRVAWESLVGQIPDGLEIDHLCFNRACVNPDHLEPVPKAVNLQRRRWTVGQTRALLNHCPQGHPYDEENTYRSGDPRSGRQCKICMRTRTQIRGVRGLRYKHWTESLGPDQCSESDCSALVRSHGLCNAHYLRVRRLARKASPSEGAE